MRQLKRLASSPYFKAVVGTATLGGLGYAAYYQSSKATAEIATRNIIQEGKETQVSENVATIQEAVASKKQGKQVEKETEKKQTPEVIVQDLQKKQEKVQQEEKKQQPSQQKAKKQLTSFSRINEIDEFKYERKFQAGEMILIVADLPFTPEFEAKIVTEINKLKSKFKSLRVYRKDILNSEAKSFFETESKAKIEEQTLFLLRNTFDKGLNYFNFDMYMQYPLILEAYLKNTQKFQDGNIKDAKKILVSLNPYESCVLYIYDKSEPEQKVRERLMTAKFIEMELVVNNLKGVQLLAVQRSAAIQSGLIDEKNGRVNSLHLFRPHNIYTPFEPNYAMELDNKENIPFYRLSDIALFQSKSNKLMIPAYLSSLETFDSTEVAAPFICSVRVDRNKISEEDYLNIVKIFGQIKRNNSFPDVAFTLKLKEVPYGGANVPKNSEWQISLANADEMEKETMMHEISNNQQLKALGFVEEEYMKARPEYLYEHSTIDKELIERFLALGLQGKLGSYYKSEEKHTLSNIRKTSGANFQKDILLDNSDHVVYEYSQFCPTCKKISPYVSLLADYAKKKEIGLSEVKFHRIDANKNRVKDYLSSPYIPNLYYYKKEWNNAPARYPIENLAKGLVSLFHFCLINKEVGTIEWKVIEQEVAKREKHIRTIMNEL